MAISNKYIYYETYMILQNFLKILSLSFPLCSRYSPIFYPKASEDPTKRFTDKIQEKT